VKKVPIPGVEHYLRKAELNLECIAEEGGAVWLFGSRAAGCARRDSDWDLLVLTPSTVTQDRRKCGRADIIYVALTELQTWASSELAAHVEVYGMRLDEGPPIQINANPIAAAVRKRALVAVRSRFLDRYSPSSSEVSCCGFDATRTVVGCWQRGMVCLQPRSSIERGRRLVSSLESRSWIPVKWHHASGTRSCLGRLGLVPFDSRARDQRQLVLQAHCLTRSATGRGRQI
jgi:Polymerase beta, Nucleotidyltransferase